MRFAARNALVVFFDVEVAGLGLYLVLGRHQWFFVDEWDFLSARSAGSVNDLFQSHQGHWCTLPILAYRLLWTFFGIRTYLPYLFLAVLLHLIAAGLLRAVMRRAGVGPWISTAAASLFVLLGAGWQDIEEAFQITFVGSLVFGLTQLLFADHDGPIDRRDWLGLAAGACGLLCSGVALTMIVAVGVSALIRRGWHAAAFHTVPLGIAYALWATTTHVKVTTTYPTLGQYVAFVVSNVRTAFGATGSIPGVGVALALLLLTGLVLARTTRCRAGFVGRAAPVGLLVGAMFFMLTTALARAAIEESAPAKSRYLHIFVALVLPAIAVAGDVCVRRWRWSGTVVVMVLLVGIPGNMRVLADQMQTLRPLHASTRATLLSAPRLPIANQLPPSIRPDPAFAPWVTIGWLRGNVKSGRIPDPGPISVEEAATTTLRLSLQPFSPPRRAQACVPLTRPVHRTLNKGDWIRNGGQTWIEVRQGRSNPVLLFAFNTVVAVVDNLSLNIQPLGTHVTLCTAN